MTQTATIVKIQDRFQSESVPKVSRSGTRRRTSRAVVHSRYRIGALYKQPSGCWAARITDLESGRTFKKSSGVRKKGDALDALEALLRRPEDDGSNEPPKTFGDAVVEFLAVRCPQVRPATAKDYRHVCDRLTGALGSVLITDLSYDTIEGHVTDLVSEGKGRAAAKHLGMCRMILGWVVKRGLIDRDPSAGVRSPQYEKKEIRVPTAEEATALLAACKKPYLRKIVALGLLCGFRRKTLVSLRVSDLDVSTRTINVDGSRMKCRVGVQVPVRADLFQLLLEDLPTDPDAPLVGQKVRCFKNGFERACKAAGMEWMEMHSCRRFFASQLAAAGTDYAVLQELLGHATGTDVTRRYIDPSVLETKKREAVDRLPAIL